MFNEELARKLRELSAKRKESSKYGILEKAKELKKRYLPNHQPELSELEKLKLRYKPKFSLVLVDRKTKKPKTSSNVQESNGENGQDDGDEMNFDQTLETPSEQLRNCWQLNMEKLAYSYLKYYGTHGEPNLRAIEPVNPPVCEDEHCTMPKYKI